MQWSKISWYLPAAYSVASKRLEAVIMDTPADQTVLLLSMRFSAHKWYLISVTDWKAGCKTQNDTLKNCTLVNIRANEDLLFVNMLLCHSCSYTSGLTSLFALTPSPNTSFFSGMSREFDTWQGDLTSADSFISTLPVFVN